MYQEITPADVGARLRSIRRSRSLSLKEVEDLSEGELKAVVLGSYERGTRNLTIKRTIEIAKIYNIPVAEILGEKSGAKASDLPKLMLDIRALQRVAARDSGSSAGALLAQLLRIIIEDRQDWNGEIITLRNSDFGTISLLLQKQKRELIQWLATSGILLQKKVIK